MCVLTAAQDFAFLWTMPNSRPVLLTLHKNLHRLASLAFCVANAPRSRPTTVSQVAANYERVLTKPCPVSEDALERVATYISERVYIQKYGGTRGATLQAVVDGIASGKTIEMQDWFLSDPAIPSRTGAEKEMSPVKTVAACQELGLLRDKTVTIGNYGELLLEVARERGLLGALEGAGTNPFLPDAAYVTAAFLQVLRHDLDFQAELLRRIDPQSTSWLVVADRLGAILRDVKARIPSSVANKRIHEWLGRQRLAADKLKNREGVATGTLLRPVEDLLHSRLEFLVDFGALHKPDPGRYEYARGPAYDGLLDLLEGGDDKIQAQYFRAVAAMWKKRARYLEDEPEVLEHVRRGHKIFKNVAGYAPILESTVYANVSSWGDDPWPIVEISESFRALGRLARTATPRVRINPDRFRRPFTFRIVE